MPVRVRSAATRPWKRRARTGVRYSGWTRATPGKKSPSRPIANTTRAPARVRPFTQPKVEIRIATAMKAPPAGPIMRTAASVAMRLSRTVAISPIGTM